MTLMDYAKANVRTIVPFVVAAIITFALKHGINLHGYAYVLTTVVGAVYYAVVRALERYVTPKFGWLLGIAQQPVYAKVSKRRDVPFPNSNSTLNSASFTLTTSGAAAYVPPTPRARDRLALLLPPSGRKLGHLPSPRDDRDYRYKATVRPPKAVHNGAGLVYDPLGNLSVGDCAEAGEEHARQIVAHLNGSTYTPTTDGTIGLYSAITGYRPGDESTDNGTVLRQMLAYLHKQGVITQYQAVALDTATLKAAITEHGVVLCGFALPAGAETEGVKWRVPRSGKAAGSWGGHCVPLCGFSAETFDLVSWGELGSSSEGFISRYLDEAWVLTFSGADL